MSAQILDREEYIEQAYFFRVFRERVADNVPAQDILSSVHEEILSTAKLPMALEFLNGEMQLHGRMSDGMAHLSHYFLPFQTFIMTQAEAEGLRFDQSIALQILEGEARYRAESPTRAGLFIYQFECIARNRLGYEPGLLSVAEDPMYDSDWRNWILKIRRQLGAVDFADMLYYRSEFAVEERRRRSGDLDYQSSYPILFGLREGRIAKANRGRDPLHMFAALQRQLGYPTVPRPKVKSEEPSIDPALESRLKRIEQALKLLDSEVKGDLDLSQFYVKPSDFEQADQQ